MEVNENEKKYIYPAVAVILLILLFTLFLIWKPNKKDVIEENINRLNITLEYDVYQKEKYSNILDKLLRASAFDELYEKIDFKWMEKNGLVSKDEVRNYLFDNNIITSNKVNIEKSELFCSKDMYVFKYVVKDSSGQRKNVIINETKPNKYTISFEQGSINSLEDRKYRYSSEGVEYEVNVEYADNNLIQYSIEITNASNDSYEWIMNNPMGIYLELEDYEIITASNVTTFADNEVFLNKGNSLKFKINFNISLEKQSKIKNIKFEDVYKNGIKTGNVIVLKGSEV